MSDSVNIEKLAKLREPFPQSAVSKLPKGGVMLDYIGHANITDRLLNIDPLWYWEPVAFDERGLPAMDYDAQGKPVGLWIRLTVCGVSRLGYGTCEARKNEIVKELIGDALRNAAMRFGVALELWSKAELESQHDENAPRQSTPAPRQSARQASPQSSNGQSHANGNGRAPQAAPAPRNAPPQTAPRLTPMQELMKLCEGAQLCIDEQGRAIVPQIVNVLKKENFSTNISTENYSAAFTAIQRHYEAPAPTEPQRGAPMPVAALAREFDETDEGDPFDD